MIQDSEDILIQIVDDLMPALVESVDRKIFDLYLGGKDGLSQGDNDNHSFGPNCLHLLAIAGT